MFKFSHRSGAPVPPVGRVVAFAVPAAVGAVAALRGGTSRRADELVFLRRLADGYLNVAGSMVLVLDDRGIVTTANHATCLTLGRPLEEIVGREWFGLAIPLDTRERDRRVYTEVMAHRIATVAGVASSENQLVRRDGSRVTVRWRAEVLTDRRGRSTGLICSGTDLTRERAAQAALDRNRVELEQLRRLAQQVASLDDARQAIVDLSCELTGARFVALSEPTADGALVTTTATMATLLGQRFELGTTTARLTAAFATGEPQFIADVDGADTLQALVDAIGCASVVHQPISGPTGALGVLTVGWEHRVDSLEARASELVGLAAEEAASALGRLESLAQLERAALIDPLTGVANRRAFDAQLPAAMGDAGVTGRPLALVVMDLNDFKLVNDLNGHVAGDQLLVASCTAWAEALRTGDSLARIGGDEFAVVLPDCDHAEMSDIVVRLRAVTPHVPSTSLGGVVWDGKESASDLLRRADAVQYEDKAAGKRRRSDRPLPDPGAPDRSGR